MSAKFDFYLFQPVAKLCSNDRDGWHFARTDTVFPEDGEKLSLSGLSAPLRFGAAVMGDSKEIPRATASTRVVFVDQARAIAIILMLFGHSLHRFLAEPWRSGDFYTAYQPVRGVSSTLFIMVAGFSFVVATFGHWEDYLKLTPRMWARIRRIGLILFLGYLLNLWAPTLVRAIDIVTAEKWERFLRCEVLQNIGFGLAALHLLVWVAGTKKRFCRLTTVLALAVLALAALTYRKDIDLLLPIELSTMLNLYHGSRFPIVPYTGFMLLGALYGALYLKRKEAGDEWKVFAAGMFASILLIGLEVTIPRAVAGGVFPYWAPLDNMPGNTFGRAGAGILTISVLYFLGRFKVVLPRLAFILSKDSLSIYFTHLFLVYGTSAIPGLFSSRKSGMSPAQVACWIVGLFVTMTAMAWAIGWLRANSPELLAGVRRAAILGLLLAFVTLPELSVAGMTSCMASAALMVIVAPRWRFIRAKRA
jgi:hypothetical protein